MDLPVGTPPIRAPREDLAQAAGWTVRAAGQDGRVSAQPAVLAAFQNAALEEVLMIGFLFTRFRQLGWQLWAVVGVSAVIRGSYHLYQGFGGFVGNLVMGVILGLVYLRWQRVAPLVVAHTLLDVVAFVGYALVARTSAGSEPRAAAARA